PQIACRRYWRTLRQTLHRYQLGKYRRHQTRLVKQVDSLRSPGTDQQLSQLVRDALHADRLDLVRHSLNGKLGLRFNPKGEPGGNASCPQHPQLVFLETLHGVADGPQDPCVQVLTAADIVDKPVFDWIEEHSVDGKIPAQRILFCRGEGHGVGVPAVGVRDVRAKRRHLDFQSTVRILGSQYFDD